MAMSLMRMSPCKPSLPGGLLNKEGCKGGSPRATDITQKCVLVRHHTILSTVVCPCRGWHGLRWYRQVRSLEVTSVSVQLQPVGYVSRSQQKRQNYVDDTVVYPCRGWHGLRWYRQVRSLEVTSMSVQRRKVGYVSRSQKVNRQICVVMPMSMQSAEIHMVQLVCSTPGRARELDWPT